MKSHSKLKLIRFRKFGLIVLSAFLLTCASDDEDCIKTISIPQFYVVGNQTYSTEISQDVPCDFPEPTDAELIEAPTLENFTYQILSLNIIEDTGNNTWALQFEIQLNNNNDFDVTGIPRLYVVSNGLEFSGSYSNNAINPCYSISADSNCLLTFDQEESLNLGPAPESFEITDVDYVLTN